MTDYNYVLYIDEAGDPGLQRIEGVDPVGASEWMVLTGVLIGKRNEKDVQEWVQDISDAVGVKAFQSLHFKKLKSFRNKSTACTKLSTLPIRAFTIISNKRNMRQHRNVRAEKLDSKDWFYNWMVRLLLERVTNTCYSNSLAKRGEVEKVKICFSHRKHHDYDATIDYIEKLKNQSKMSSTKLNWYEVVPDVLDRNLIETVYADCAGVHLPDIVASAFFQAVRTQQTQWDDRHVKKLKPIMAIKNGKVAKHGLVLQPHNISSAALDKRQINLLKYFGYQFF